MLNDDALIQLFAPLARSQLLVLAVSGGPDSMALMALARRWQALLGAKAPNLGVVSVDHALRQESAAECALVAQVAGQLGLPHTIAVWQGPKPATGLMERARIARYQLLQEAARSLGASGIVTAHHADDQAETILLRLAHGTSITGLAGMRLHETDAGLDLWRPLLGLTKRQLVDYCTRNQLAYCQDPSNLDPKYARTRLRHHMALMQRLGLDRAALLRLGTRAARADAALQSATSDLLAKLGLPGDASVEIPQLRFEAAMLQDVPDEIILRALAEIMARVGQWQGYRRLERLERLLGGLQAARMAGQNFSATLSGAKIKLDKKGHLLVQREMPRKGRGSLV
ncbi:MAG: tRNA lysidine(34) synthetase TilS [Hyphomicrobiales bacterium]|nr:tRNA lysidine(34) synthetase TilS [Hyphomicrobiales bacterium]MDE2114827.1 tRNA lysidine(34) synthetase TilS [Hyphomicrobiales bacterium]